MLDYALEIEHFDNHLLSILQTLEEIGELENTIVVVTADHGMPFPRCKGQEYEYSNHVPFAIMWKNKIQSGREAYELLSFIDLAPTFLDLAGISHKQAGMQPIEGESFLPLLKDENDQPQRDYVLIGKERHDVGRPDDQGYPIRGIIKGDYLYLINFETDRWPAGNPETGYLNVDGSPTKTEIIQSRHNTETMHYWQLSLGKRKKHELYNIRTDRECMSDLIDDVTYAKLAKDMKEQLLETLKSQQDPRLLGNGAVFDEYTYMGKERNVWNRMKQGEKIKLGFINETDLDPQAADVGFK